MTKAKSVAQRRKSRGRPKLAKPGCTVLPEDQPVNYNRMLLKQTDRSRSRPVARTEKTFASMSLVETRLLTAMKTIRAMPDREKRFQTLKGASIPYVQEYMDAYNSSDVRTPIFVPTPRDISDCLTALSWARHVERKIWNIMWLRSFGFSFGLIAKYNGRSDETVRRWYREGVTDAWTAANGVAA